MAERSRQGRIERIESEAAPAAVGPYSQAVAAAGLVFTAGQIGLEPASGRLVTGGIEAETEQVMRNLRAVLEAAGLDFGAVVRATIYLVELADFQTVNVIYARHLGEQRPARSTVGVAALPLGARIEIDLLAVRPG